MLATPEGTATYAHRLGADPSHWRPLGTMTVSSIGLGTYLGPDTDEADAALVRSIHRAIGLGCNVFDAAINYRHQRSERAIGRALQESFEAGKGRREEVVVCTKGGYLPFDRDVPPDPAQYLRATYLEGGLLQPEDLVDGCHALSPRFLEDQLQRSLNNLLLPGVDVYYVHNPEHAFSERDRAEIEGRLGEVFAMLERACDAGKVGRYGVATWNGLRVPPAAPEHLSLERLVSLAREAAGSKEARFGIVQAPLNLAMPEALAAPTQVVQGKALPLLEAAQRFGVAVMASASLLQGRLTRGLSPGIQAALGLPGDSARALQFARSCPGITTALVGMGRIEHVEQNLALAQVPTASPDQMRALVEGRKAAR